MAIFNIALGIVAVMICAGLILGLLEGCAKHPKGVLVAIGILALAVYVTLSGQWERVFTVAVIAIVVFAVVVGVPMAMWDMYQKTRAFIAPSSHAPVASAPAASPAPAPAPAEGVGGKAVSEAQTSKTDTSTGWLILRDDKQYGPFPLADFFKYVDTGRVLYTDMVLLPPATEWRRMDSFPGLIKPLWSFGDRVFHQKFGSGNVIEADGSKLTILFDKAGEKRVADSFVERL